jgi:hypothetical protein
VHGDIERLVEEEMATINDHCRELDKLRDEPTCAVLREAELRGVLTGTSRDQWATATAAIQAADSRLGKWRATVTEASRLLRASPPDPRQAERLLRGRSVRLTPAEIPKEDRQPPSPSYSDPRFSLRTVGDYVTADLRTARAALTELRGELDDVRGRLGADPEERELLRGRLEVYQHRARRRGLAGPALDAQYRRARQLLDAEPCDLRQAAEAVREYMVMERGDPPEPGNHER